MLIKPLPPQDQPLVRAERTGEQAFYEWLKFIDAGGKPIESKTANASAALDFTSIDNSLDVYAFELVGLLPVVNNDTLYLVISQDHGATWKTGATDYRWAGNFNTDAGASATLGSASDSVIRLTNATVSNNAARNLTGTVKLYRPAVAGVYKNMRFDLEYFSAASGLVRVVGSALYQTDTNAINGIRFGFLGGNVVSGAIYLNGVRKS
jgi:hypothetical protein